MLLPFLCFLILPYVFGGSPCPDRKDIYPCICLDRSIGKSKFETTVICHGLENGDSYSMIKFGLTYMEVDKFLLYDSFWQNDERRIQMDQNIPMNAFSGFKIKEIEIVDTGTRLFGCPEKYNCGTNYLQRLTSTNSTMYEKERCDSNSFSIYLWASCPGALQYLKIDNGFPTDLTLKPDFFPEPMTRLKSLHLPNNRISRIDRRTFSANKFPLLHTLDLSHNSLRDARNLFSSILKLKHLDLSHNNLRTVLDFTLLPHLQILKLDNNNIQILLENEWQNVPKVLKQVDFSGNELTCNCGFKWVNSTFEIHTHLKGTCTNPVQVANMKIRRASRLLSERCNEEGKILNSKIKHS